MIKHRTCLCRLWPVVTVITLFSTIYGSPTPRASFRVLAVGIDHYSGGHSGWADLHGTKDVKKISAAISRYWGQGERLEIKALLDRDATKEAIEKGFEDWLVKDAKPSDKMVFYFSGHGTLVPAPDLQTRVRSAILPFDAKSDLQGLVASSLITGAYFRDQLIRLKRAGIQNLTLVFDSCNSAAISRGAVRSKTVENPAVKRLAFAGQLPKVAVGSESSSVGPMVISAARADRSAYESEDGSYLTNAIVTALQSSLENRSHLTSDFTYADLRDGVMANLALMPQPEPQEPSFAGNLSRNVFGTRTPALDPYFLVEQTPTETLVDAGSLFGVGQGTRFAIYKAGTNTITDAKPIAFATATNVGGYRSKVKIYWVADHKTHLGGSRAKVVSEARDASLSVDFSRVSAIQKYRGLVLKLVGSGLFHSSKAGHMADVVIRPPSRASSQWQVEDSVSNVLLVASADLVGDELFQTLREDLIKVAKHKALLTLKSADPEFQLEIQVRPATVEQKIHGREVVQLAPDDACNSVMSLDPNQPFVVRIRAKRIPGKIVSANFVYVTAIDCTPSSEVSLLWPHVTPANEEARLLADGKWRYLGHSDDKSVLVGESDLSLMDGYALEKNPVAGQEVLKVIATSESGIDYQALLTRQSKDRGAPPRSALGKLLAAYRDGLPLRRGRSDSETSSYTISSAVLTCKVSGH